MRGSAVSPLVAVKLCLPKLPPRLRVVPAGRASVPKTPIHEHRDPGQGKDEIGSAVQAARLDRPARDTSSHKRRPQTSFSTLVVTAAHRGHPTRPHAIDATKRAVRQRQAQLAFQSHRSYLLKMPFRVPGDVRLKIRSLDSSETKAQKYPIPAI